jgi:hypothetical protein
MTPLTVTLPAHQWQLILNVLGTAAYRDVAEVIAVIVTQTNTPPHAAGSTIEIRPNNGEDR